MSPDLSGLLEAYRKKEEESRGQQRLGGTNFSPPSDAFVESRDRLPLSALLAFLASDARVSQSGANAGYPSGPSGLRAAFSQAQDSASTSQDRAAELEALQVAQARQALRKGATSSSGGGRTYGTGPSTTRVPDYMERQRQARQQQIARDLLEEQLLATRQAREQSAGAYEDKNRNRDIIGGNLQNIIQKLLSSIGRL